MTHIVPFIKYFTEESMKRRSLAGLYDADFNKATYELQETPVDIAPRAISNGAYTFSYTEPVMLYVYPSKADGEEYLLKSEQLIEACHGITNQIVFEVRGNEEEVYCSFYGEVDDIAIIASALRNSFPNTYTERGEVTPFTGDFFVYDFLPDAPFYTALTPYESFSISPININVQTLMILENGDGVYQIIIRPLPGIVHELVNEAVDCDWQAMQGADSKVAPSKQAGTASKRLEYKSPEFRSYYSVCARIILPTNRHIAKVKAFISNYLYGLKAFSILDNTNYSQVQILSMLNDRSSFHAGFLCNSLELTSLLHIPFQVLEDKELADRFASTPPGDRPMKTTEYEDIIIGKWACKNSSKAIHLPVQIEVPHVHVVGVSRSGKSILLGHMAIEKLTRGESVFLLDPHGDLVDNVLRMVPKEFMDKVVVIDFGLEDLTPQITIRANVDITVPGKVSDDLTESMRDASGSREKFWGPRMAYAFQCLYFIYCVTPDLDITHLRLLISKSKRAKILRAKVKAKITHPIIKDFLDELEYSSQEQLMPVITRIAHLLIDEKSLRLLTVKENKISISEIMENGKLCLINLSIGTIGRQRSSILCGLVESLVVNNALSRAKVPYEKRKPCTLIKDEFYLGPGDLDMQLSSLAKYNISTVFAHQYLDQVEGVTREVMATAGTHIAFKLRRKDAEKFACNFGVEPEEFTSLKKFQAIMKVEDEVVKIETPRPAFNNEDLTEAILQNCYELYYQENANNEPVKKKLLTFDTL